MRVRRSVRKHETGYARLRQEDACGVESAVLAYACPLVLRPFNVTASATVVLRCDRGTDPVRAVFGTGTSESVEYSAEEILGSRCCDGGWRRSILLSCNRQINPLDDDGELLSGDTN